MPTVDELLNNTIESQVCTIDPDTRVINVPACYKEFGVEADEKVNRIKFQCPKIVGDNIDLTTFNLYINYMNARGNYNAYLVDDVTVSGDNITFSWLLSRHVTEKSGTVNYIVCAKKSDDTSVLNEWNTKVATATVGIGLEATTVVEEQNADVIEQILIKLNSAKNDEPLVVEFSNDRGKMYTNKNVETICNAAASGRRVLTNDGKVLIHYDIGGVANDKLYWALFAGSSNAQSAELGFVSTEEYCGNVPGSFIGPWNQHYVEDLTNPLGLRNSQVGQIAQISRVDSNGKPISWKTVDVLTTTNTTTFTPTKDYHPATKKYIDVNLQNLASATMDYVDEAINSIPSESNVSLNVTGATVGQTVKISAVDNNGVPTAWEPVDVVSGEKWEKIAEIVIPDGAAETNALTINKDINGDQFRLIKARLCVKQPKYTGDSSIPSFSFAMINGKTSGRIRPLAYTSAFRMPSKSMITGSVYEVDVSGAQQIETVYRSGNGGLSDDSSSDFVTYSNPHDEYARYVADTLWAKPITSIGGAGMLIYPGCRYVLYGVRE